MTPDTLDFTGNAVTIFGFVGVLFAFATLVTVFRSYWNSPYRR